VEVKSVFQEFKVFLGWVVEMTPSQVPDFQAVNHYAFPLSLKVNTQFTSAQSLFRAAKIRFFVESRKQKCRKSKNNEGSADAIAN
jgi:hypothetical protein